MAKTVPTVDSVHGNPSGIRRGIDSLDRYGCVQPGAILRCGDTEFSIFINGKAETGKRIAFRNLDFFQSPFPVDFGEVGQVGFLELQALLVVSNRPLVVVMQGEYRLFVSGWGWVMIALPKI